MVLFDIKDYVGRVLGGYPESLMKIGHDLAEKKFVPGVGSGWGHVGSWPGFLYVKVMVKARAYPNVSHCSRRFKNVVEGSNKYSEAATVTL